MIKANARLSIALVPLDKIVVKEFQRRYPDRLAHYARLLEAHLDEYAGLLSIEPLGDDKHYVLLDGHHRFAASILVGRKDALCLIIEEPGQESEEELVCDGMGGFMQQEGETVL